MLLENKNLRDCDYFATIPSCSNSTMSLGDVLYIRIARSTFELNTGYYTFMFFAQVLIKTANVEISRYFAGDGTELLLKACRTWSTLIFLVQPIKSLIYSVVFAFEVVDAKAPQCTILR